MVKKCVKLLSIILIFCFLGIFNVSANEPKKIAEDYIKEMEDFGPFWKDKEPKIVGEVPFYTYDDKTPSYIEYKVSCNDDVNCGYVLVNIDGTDADVPMASTTGRTLSEQMKKGNKNKNYYFDIFNQFSITNTGIISTISPENKSIDNGENIFSRTGDVNPLYERFKKFQKEVNKNKKNYKDYQRIKKYTYRTITPIYNNDSGVIHNKFFSDVCKSLTPCYTQGVRDYTRGKDPDDIKEYITIQNVRGATGCTPTAISIIFGFYDKYLNEDIIEGEAPSFIDNVITKLQIDLGDEMLTYYNNGSGSTLRDNTVEGFKYLGKKRNIFNHNGGFRVEYNDVTFWDYIMEEINAGRPLMLDYNTIIDGEESGHIIVIQGYTKNRLSANFGWGKDSVNKIISLNGRNFSGYESGVLKNIYLFRFN